MFLPRLDLNVVSSSFLTLVSRVAVVCLVLICSACALATHDATAPERTKAPSTLLADTQGQISVVAISLNSARRAALRNAELAVHLINGLSGVDTVYILTNDRSAFTVVQNPWPEKISFLEIPFENPITIWTQDPFLVLKSDLEITLLTSREFDRADDLLMAESIAQAAGYRLKHSDLYFEGGNIVSDESSIFIGANTIRYNAVTLGISEIEVVLAFQEELGRKVLVVGPVPQPIAHIDMVLTPLGHGRVALADATAGIRIAEKALEENPSSVKEFEKSVEAGFFGHPSIKHIRGKDGQKITAPELAGKTREMIERSKSVAPVLDGIAVALGRYGYQVERIPFLFGGPEAEVQETDDKSFKAGYPMLTYNNALISTERSSAVVYVPQYGWPEMDQAAQAAWEALNYRVQPIEGLAVSAMYGGALRCAVKVLERKVQPQPVH